MTRNSVHSIDRWILAVFIGSLLFLPFQLRSQHGEQSPVAAESTVTHTNAAVPESEAGHEKKGEDNVIAQVLEHKVADTPYIHEYPFPEIQLPQFAPVYLGGMKIDFSFTRHLIYLWISGAVTIAMLWGAARQNKKRRAPRGFGNLIEMVVVFVRDEIAVPVLGHNAKKYLPILLTFFFFIATSNMIGLLPFGATATGNINITAALAITSFLLMLGGGMRSNGVFGYVKGLLPSGIPMALQPLMFVIEIIGLFTKPFALCVRLFANMLSGGLVIGAFYALIFGLHSIAIAPVSLAFLLFMTLLKLFVCLLQAYIFTMLTAFFLGMAVHQEH